MEDRLQENVSQKTCSGEFIMISNQNCSGSRFYSDLNYYLNEIDSSYCGAKSE